MVIFGPTCTCMPRMPSSLPALLVEVDDVDGLMSVDPMAMVVAFDEDAEIVPLAGLELLDLQFVDDPRLALRCR